MNLEGECIFNEYFNIQKQIYDYFGYVEDWRVLPLEDSRDYFWELHQDTDGSGEVYFADTRMALQDKVSPNQEIYSNEIYTQRHLSKWVYRGKDFTLICVDTHTDGNQYLQIFTNAYEVHYG